MPPPQQLTPSPLPSLQTGQLHPQPWISPEHKWLTQHDGPKEALALWAFIHPSRLAQAEEWLKVHRKRRSGFRGKQRLSLNLEQLRALQAHLGVRQPEQQPWLQLLYQCPGDKVQVPPGWVHQVWNLRPNLKVAFDVYRVADLGQYLRSWRQVGSRYTGPSNMRDYMAVGKVLLNAAARSAERHEREQQEREQEEQQR